MYQWNPVIVTHAVLAGTAVILGAALLKARKGTMKHRAAGWIWVLCMAGVAGLSFAIQGPNGYSWIHGLSVFSLMALVWGVLFARLHRVRHHRFSMISMYAGALLVTGLFTLLPNRLLGSAVWGFLGLK
jgi:uncharacterized membrane protein